MDRAAEDRQDGAGGAVGQGAAGGAAQRPVQNARAPGNRQCYHCGQRGHLRAVCPNAALPAVPRGGNAPARPRPVQRAAPQGEPDDDVVPAQASKYADTLGVFNIDQEVAQGFTEEELNDLQKTMFGVKYATEDTRTYNAQAANLNSLLTARAVSDYRAIFRAAMTLVMVCLYYGGASWLWFASLFLTVFVVVPIGGEIFIRHNRKKPIVRRLEPFLFLLQWHWYVWCYYATRKHIINLPRPTLLERSGRYSGAVNTYGMTLDARIHQQLVETHADPIKFRDMRTDWQRQANCMHQLPHIAKWHNSIRYRSPLLRWLGPASVPRLGYNPVVQDELLVEIVSSRHNRPYISLLKLVWWTLRSLIKFFFATTANTVVCKNRVSLSLLSQALQSRNTAHADRAVVQQKVVDACVQNTSVNIPRDQFHTEQIHLATAMLALCIHDRRVEASGF